MPLMRVVSWSPGAFGRRRYGANGWPPGLSGRSETSMSGSLKVRVFVASDVRVYREGVSRLVATEDALELTGAARTAESSTELCGGARPDVVLLDASQTADVASARAIASAAGEAHVVALVAPDTEVDLLDWAAAGVSGFLSTEASPHQLVEVLRRAADGESPCSPDVADAFLTRAREQGAGPGALAEALTTREAQIAELVAEGMSNKAIASRLSIELATVKNHVHSILGKLSVHSRGEAAAKLRRTVRRRGVEQV
jgi:two-component system, NarL family, nitrate/nitrite response regulator NarL